MMSPAITHTCIIRNYGIRLDGRLLFESREETPAAFFTALYRQLDPAYPKFFKMDNLCRLGFLASEVLMKAAMAKNRFSDDEVGIVLSNAASSIDTDRNHQASITNRDNYFPSPSVFVYTLANIVIGEICIRQKITGESCFFIEKEFSAVNLYTYVTQLFENDLTLSAIAGRVEMNGPHYEAVLCFIEKAPVETKGIVIFDPEEIHKLYQQKN